MYCWPLPPEEAPGHGTTEWPPPVCKASAGNHILEPIQNLQPTQCRNHTHQPRTTFLAKHIRSKVQKLSTWSHLNSFVRKGINNNCSSSHLISIITFAKEVMFLAWFAFLPLCLPVTSLNFIKFGGKVQHGSKKNPLHIEADQYWSRLDLTNLVSLL